MRNPVELGKASVTRRPPAREEGGMVALSQMPTFLAVEQKKILWGHRDTMSSDL